MYISLIERRMKIKGYFGAKSQETFLTKAETNSLSSQRSTHLKLKIKTFKHIFIDFRPLLFHNCALKSACTSRTTHLREASRHSVWPHKQTRPISASTTVITARARRRHTHSLFLSSISCSKSHVAFSLMIFIGSLTLLHL